MAKKKYGNVEPVRVLSLIGGGVASGLINNTADNMPFVVNNRGMYLIAKAGLGVFGMTQKNQIVSDVATGFVVTSAVEALQYYNILSGIDMGQTQRIAGGTVKHRYQIAPPHTHRMNLQPREAHSTPQARMEFAA